MGLESDFSPLLVEEREPTVQRRYPFRKPVPSSEDVRDIPEVVASLERLADRFLFDRGRFQFGLPTRALVVLHGETLTTRNGVAESFAERLGAQICDVPPHVDAPEGDQFLKQMILAGIEHADISLFHITDRNVDLERIRMMGIRPALDMNADEIFNGYSYLDALDPWRRAILVMSVLDLETIDPSIQSHANLVLQTDFTVDGAAEVIRRTAETIGKRSEGAIAFHFEPTQTADLLWRAGCRDRNSLIRVVERAVELKREGGEKSLERPVGNGHILNAWDLRKEKS